MPVAIFDMDGVLYRGSIVMPYAQEALARLRKAGWQVFFATNNSTATRDEYVMHLQALGLGGDLEHIITSAYATAHYLERLVPKPKDVLVIGADGLRSEIRAVGIGVRDADSLPGLDPPPDAAADGASPGAMRRYLTSLALPPPPDTVVVGLDLHLTYAKIAEAQRAILAGARFVCSNRDRAYPVEGRLLPGAGTIVAAIEVATEHQAVCIGKPEPFLFEEALRRASLGEGSARAGRSSGTSGSGLSGLSGLSRTGPVIVIGDSTDYDMVAAHKVGATGVLTLTGLDDQAALDGAKGEAAPDHVIRSLEELFMLPELAGT